MNDVTTEPLPYFYFQREKQILEATWVANERIIAEAAPVIGASIAQGGVVHTFGSGHSEVISREIIGRAGGLVCASGLFDPTGGFIENLPGYGRILAERYDRQHQLRPGETMIVISNSGKNTSPIDVALYAREKGLKVVALTSLAMSRATPSQHPSKKRLFECADFVLDNGGVPGDAVVDLGGGVNGGPTSTVVGCSVLNWLMLAVIAWLKAEGQPVPVLKSQNMPGAIEHNRELARRYQGRLSRQLA
jgi:uncharacterized phosphosugar-binding protein